MAENREETADAVDRAVTGAVESLEKLFDEQRTVSGGSTLAEGSARSTGAGKGFRFPSVEDANKIISSFKARQKSIAQRKVDIDRVRYLLIGVPFATDSVSVSYLRAVEEALSKFEVLNDSALRYTTKYIDKLEAAKRAKLAAEEETAADFGKAAGAS